MRRPNISFPRSKATRASNRGADHRKSYTKAEKKSVVSFYLQHSREHGEVVTTKQNKTKQNKCSVHWKRSSTILMANTLAPHSLPGFAWTRCVKTADRIDAVCLSVIAFWRLISRAGWDWNEGSRRRLKVAIHSKRRSCLMRSRLGGRRDARSRAGGYRDECGISYAKLIQLRWLCSAIIGCTDLCDVGA